MEKHREYLIKLGKEVNSHLTELARMRDESKKYFEEANLTEEQQEEIENLFETDEDLKKIVEANEKLQDKLDF